MANDLKDLIIVIPGIMGSVLEDANGKSLWDPGFGMAQKLLGKKKWVENMKISVPDDPGDSSFLAGVRPTRLVESKTIVPGIHKIGGYTELHGELAKTFNLYEGDQQDPLAKVDGRPPNYFRFSYDWRRDNRASALQLKTLVEAALAPWQLYRNDANAKVIIVAHSMGGLVARWYLEGDDADGEPHEGWRNVRQLISFGTPYRGALNAVEFLVEGFRKLFVDFSDALATYRAVYQLLPRYEAILDTRTQPHEWHRIADLANVPNMDQVEAKCALTDFHQVIDRGVIAHRKLDEYDDRHVTPIVGFGHKTQNSATLGPKKLDLDDQVPDVVPPSWVRGDGTVPYISGIPLDYDGLQDASEWNKTARIGFVNKKHGSMQADADVLAAEIANYLRTTQESGGLARGDEADSSSSDPAEVAGGPQLSLDLPDYLFVDEDLLGTIQLANVDAGRVTVKISNLGTGGTEEFDLEPDPHATFSRSLPRGDYEVTATRLAMIPGLGQLSSTDLFAVIDPASDDG